MTTLARFLCYAHGLFLPNLCQTLVNSIQPCLVDKRRSWRNVVSRMVDEFCKTLQDILQPHIAVDVNRTQTGNVGSMRSLARQFVIPMQLFFRDSCVAFSHFVCKFNDNITPHPIPTPFLA